MRHAFVVLACLVVFSLYAEILPRRAAPFGDSARVTALPALIASKRPSTVRMTPAHGITTSMVDKSVDRNRTRLSGDHFTRREIRFTENRGQLVDDRGTLRSDVLYSARTGSTALFFTRSGMSAVFVQQEDAPGLISEARGGQLEPPATAQQESRASIRCVRMLLQGSNARPTITARHQCDGFDNYYLGHCPDGITGVRSFRLLLFADVYDRIDLQYHSAGIAQIKYEFIVRPGGDPSKIRMHFADADAIWTDERGDLHVRAGFGEQIHKVPYTFTDDGERVLSEYAVDGADVAFRLGAYDTSKTLVIDPFATFYGGAGGDNSKTVVTDANGYIIVAGGTSSTTLPTTSGSAQQVYGGSGDAYVAKFTDAGVHVWSTYYGGTGQDNSNRKSAVDANGNVILACHTASTDFPVTPGAFQTTKAGGTDAALVKLDGNGMKIWATYYGGTAADGDAASGADAAGNIYLCGSSTSSDLPVSAGAFQPAQGGGNDAFIAKFSGTGNLLWATYCGGSANDGVYDCTADPGANILITGATISTNFPVSALAHQTVNAGASDGFLVKFDSSGARTWATYFGGSFGETAWGVATDNSGNVFLSGTTYSVDLPVTTGAFQSTRAGEQDGFLVKFGANGARIWATYCGGTQSDYCRAVAADGNGNAIIGGVTFSSDYPVTSGAFQTSYAGGDGDCFITVFNAAGLRQWSTFLGGSGTADNLYTISTDAYANVLCGGFTSSADFPIFNAYQSALGGGSDAFIVKFDANGQLPVDYALITAAWSRSGIEIHWRTLAEQNNAGFEVQRAFDTNDENWECRGFVPGAGTTQSAMDYRFIDELQDVPGSDRAVFYRLKQCDFDGSIKYSKIVEVFPDQAPRAPLLSSPFPQPASESATVSITLHDAEVVSLALIDASGRERAMLFPALALDAGTHTIPMRWSQVPPGVYYLSLRSTRNSAVRTLVLR